MKSNVKSQLVAETAEKDVDLMFSSTGRVSFDLQKYDFTFWKERFKYCVT